MKLKVGDNIVYCKKYPPWGYYSIGKSYLAEKVDHLKLPQTGPVVTSCSYYIVDDRGHGFYFDDFKSGASLSKWFYDIKQDRKLKLKQLWKIK